MSKFLRLLKNFDTYKLIAQLQVIILNLAHTIGIAMTKIQNG
ncbi:hypothetical protein [Lactobacillus xujianguonis]|nr:hypothetical protein [Lactobacillus xujianguonis]